MNHELKNKITEALKLRMSDRDMSQQQTATAINISAATVNSIINRTWQAKDNLVSDAMWNQVSAWLGIEEDWNIVEDDVNFKGVTRICRDAQQKSISRAIADGPGMSKSEPLKTYAKRNANVYYIECGEYWTKKVFLRQLMQAMSISIDTGSLHEMVMAIVDKLRKDRKPLVILDEADKLKDSILQFFITFYNETNNSCGFVLCGSVFFKNRIEKGVRLNRQGFREVHSRFGGEFWPLRPLNEQRITKICQANGVTDPVQITEVCNKSNNDMRIVKRIIQNIQVSRNREVAA